MNKKKIVFEKLARDLVPAAIEAKGHVASTRVLDGAEYFSALRDKLDEEVHEFFADNNTEELADILEVVYALGRMLGVDRDELEEIRHRKRVQKGGFDKRLFLEYVEEEVGE